jgi:hypothetical protein
MPLLRPAGYFFVFSGAGGVGAFGVPAALGVLGGAL